MIQKNNRNQLNKNYENLKNSSSKINKRLLAGTTIQIITI